jgi:hypothetical protein
MAAKKQKPIQTNFRTSPQVRDRLQKFANARGVSINREINDRLERSFIGDALQLGLSEASPELFAVLNMVAAAMNAAGRVASFGSTFDEEKALAWHTDPFAFAQAVKAAQTIFEACRPPGAAGIAQHNALDHLGDGFANAILEEAATGKARTAATAARAKILRELIGDDLAALIAAKPRDFLAVDAFSGPGLVRATAMLSDPVSKDDQK